MREIKFKAKIAGTDQWIIGLPHSVYGETIDSIQTLDLRVEYIKSDTLSQFTGLKDKNGLEIFEGDSVKGVSFKEPISKKTKIEVIGIVSFSHDMGYFFNGNLRGGRTVPSLNSCLLISEN